MPCEIFTVQQAILKGGPSHLPVVVCDQSSLTEQVFQDFLQTVQNGIIGVAPAFGTHCSLQTLAFASSTQVLLVKLPSKHNHGNIRTPSHRLALLVDMLCNPAYTRYALHPERIAAGLFVKFGLKAGTLVDLWSLAHKQPTDYAVLCTVLGQQNVVPSARKVYKDEKRESGWPKRAALRAWMSCHIASADTRKSSACPMLDLSVLPEMNLQRLSKLLRDADKLDALKPTVVENDVKGEVKHRNGNLELTSTRCKSRICATDSGILHMKLRVNGKNITRSGRIAMMME